MVVDLKRLRAVSRIHGSVESSILKLPGLVVIAVSIPSGVQHSIRSPDSVYWNSHCTWALALTHAINLSTD